LFAQKTKSKQGGTIRKKGTQKKKKGTTKGSGRDKEKMRENLGEVVPQEL